MGKPKKLSSVMSEVQSTPATLDPWARAYKFFFWHVSCLFSGVPLNLEMSNPLSPLAWPIDKRTSSEFFQVPRSIYRESCSYFPYISSYIYVFFQISSYLLHISSYFLRLGSLPVYLWALGLGKNPSYLIFGHETCSFGALSVVIGTSCFTLYRIVSALIRRHSLREMNHHFDY